LTLLGALLFIWTTALTEIPPLLQRIADVGVRHTWLPLTQWTTTISLGLRLLPILREECVVVLKMISQRVDPGPVRCREAVRNRRDRTVHGIVLCCATAVRRSAEMGDAITARGGLGAVAHTDRRPGRWDALVLLGGIIVLAAGVLA
jgi:energy-coupling factor transporter transmembrane protein EcfT